MKYTVFTCGVFYERFQPGGMVASQIGVRSDIGREGQYIMDVRQASAKLPFHNEAGQPVYVCMTSAKDVARFVVAALSLSSWPREFRMRGDRMTVDQLVTTGEELRGKLAPTLYTVRVADVRTRPRFRATTIHERVSTRRSDLCKSSP